MIYFITVYYIMYIIRKMWRVDLVEEGTGAWQAIYTFQIHWALRVSHNMSAARYYEQLDNWRGWDHCQIYLFTFLKFENWANGSKVLTFLHIMDQS